MDRLRRNSNFLKLLKHSRLNKHRQLLKQPTSDQIKCFSELCNNLLHKRIRLSSAQLHQIKPHRKVVRALANRKISLREKKRLIRQQKGGFISILAPLLGTLASAILSKLVK